MTLVVVLGLVAVVIGVLVAVALGVRSMRAQERAGDDWDSPEPDSEFDDHDDAGATGRRTGERRRQGTRRASGRGQPDAYDERRGQRGRGAESGQGDGYQRRPVQAPAAAGGGGRGRARQRADDFMLGACANAPRAPASPTLAAPTP